MTVCDPEGVGLGALVRVYVGGWSGIVRVDGRRSWSAARVSYVYQAP